MDTSEAVLHKEPDASMSAERPKIVGSAGVCDHDFMQNVNEVQANALRLKYP